ncbi:AfsR/SARP family transcriptional regulator [Actinomadura oligospora]|uniref:AfsR/SARP family transcriptional regulator n=1 Tax=Actinomadura oligospora TaxID=111804 RepID=UPI0004B77EA9|nr:AfsR/SARP family transcriptional regulator [Actinomadura oligospora]
MRVRVLGPVELWNDVDRVELRGSKLRTFLASLALAHGRVVSDRTLVEMLWEDAPPATAQAQIQTYASRLRGLLGDDAVVDRHRPGYRLRIERDDLDLTGFERLAAGGRAALAEHRVDAAARALSDALALWRGEALAGVTEALADLERPRLEEARLAVLEDRIEADLALGRHAGLVPELTALVTAHPMRERPRAQLMVALYRCGRHADALAAFHEHRRVLAEELGIDPSAELQELHQAILADRRAFLAPEASVSLRTPAPAPVPARLPPPPADFTGRETALVLARAYLGEAAAPRVCAITGMGGVGKTALALRVAHEVGDAYPDGRIHVDLRGGTRRPLLPGEALAHLLNALGGQDAEQDGEGDLPRDTEALTRLYRDRLAGRRVLIVLDDASGERQVRPLLPGASGCGVLVTGRTRLAALEGAARIPLEPFEPAEAAALLARHAGPCRAAAEPGALALIAERCGFLPLAVRACGARLVGHPHRPLSRLADRLADPHRILDELCVADLDVRAVLALGHRLPRGDLRRSLRLLSLLSAPSFSLWTASVLLDRPLAETQEHVDELVEAHLLEAVPERPDRSRFHPLMRAVARERVLAEETSQLRAAAIQRVNAALTA